MEIKMKASVHSTTLLQEHWNWQELMVPFGNSRDLSKSQYFSLPPAPPDTLGDGMDTYINDKKYQSVI